MHDDYEVVVRDDGFHGRVGFLGPGFRGLEVVVAVGDGFVG